jgi:hypothetical protein
MKKLLIGILIGVAILFTFIVLGGGRYVKTLGVKTEEAGEKLEKFGKRIKKTTKSAKKTLDETTDKVKKYVP